MSNDIQTKVGNRPDNKPCIICGTELECHTSDWSTYQPCGGGEIQLIFSDGSLKFDLDYNNTVFRGIICDECAEELIVKMDRE